MHEFIPVIFRLDSEKVNNFDVIKGATLSYRGISVSFTKETPIEKMINLLSHLPVYDGIINYIFEMNNGDAIPYITAIVSEDIIGSSDLSIYSTSQRINTLNTESKTLLRIEAAVIDINNMLKAVNEYINFMGANIIVRPIVDITEDKTIFTITAIANECSKGNKNISDNEHVYYKKFYIYSNSEKKLITHIDAITLLPKWAEEEILKKSLDKIGKKHYITLYNCINDG